jgi:hypothetical protein
VCDCDGSSEGLGVLWEVLPKRACECFGCWEIDVLVPEALGKFEKQREKEIGDGG